MSGTFIAPIRLEDVVLAESSFHVDQTGPDGNTITEVKLNHLFRGLDRDETNNRYIASVALSVLVSMTEDNDSRRVVMNGSATYHGLLTCNIDEETPEDEIEQWVLSNAVSLLYAHARSHFAYLSEQSVMGRFLLPPIYVQEYLALQGAEMNE